MDVHLIRVDVYPDVLSTDNIDRIVTVFSVVLEDPKFDSGNVNSKKCQMVVSKPHARRTLSRFYVLATTPRGTDVLRSLRKGLPTARSSAELHLDLKSRHLCCWKVDMARYRETSQTRDDGSDVRNLFARFGDYPPDEQVTFYFPADITADEKQKFEQIIDASFKGDRESHDDSSDGGCEGGPTGFSVDGFDDRPGPHGNGSSESNFNAVAARWGVWSENSQRDFVPTRYDAQGGHARTHDPAMMYSLWICWVNDEVRFQFLQRGLRCRESPLLAGTSVPDHAGFWYAMESAVRCHGRESRRLMWETKLGEVGMGDDDDDMS